MNPLKPIVGWYERNESAMLPFLRMVCGGLFVFSGFSKLMLPAGYFEIVINLYQIVPAPLVPVVAHVSPWIEFLCGGLLLVGYAVNLTATILAILCIVFQVVLAQAFFRKLGFDECGCFGGRFIHLSLFESFVLDSFLAVILGRISSLAGTRFALDNLFNQPGAPSNGSTGSDGAPSGS